jgi:hypothetical protein
MHEYISIGSRNVDRLRKRRTKPEKELYTVAAADNNGDE